MANRDERIPEYESEADELMPTAKTRSESQRKMPTDHPRRTLVWKNIILQLLLHVGGFYGIFAGVTHQVQWQSLVWTILVLVTAVLATTGGAHRYYAHRSYKATLPIRIALTILTVVAGQDDMIEWARNHRVHHKFTETDADPHDARRGFFFSHMGWLMVRKHPEVRRRGRTLNFSDLYNDPLLRFQRKYYVPLFLFLNLLLPIYVPMVLWKERLSVSTGFCLARYMICLHGVWTVNSFAHMYGTKPYDRGIEARECIVPNIFPTGEGWHNYHHCFPYDYRASEWGWQLNITTMIIDLMAYFGLVYDLKFPAQSSIDAKKARSGRPTKNVWEKCGIVNY